MPLLSGHRLAKLFFLPFLAPTVPSPLASGHPEGKMYIVYISCVLLYSCTNHGRLVECHFCCVTDVPVKPQRPSRAVITKRLAAAVTVGQSQDTSSSSSRPRTWTATIFQNLLHS